jgi:peptide/nickel transport system substrate-binding protein
MRLRVALCALVGLASVAVLADGAIAQEGKSPRRGGVLREILSPEPSILLSSLNGTTPTAIVASKMVEGLLRFDFKLNPLPSLAKSWTISPDGLTYTFKLQDNATWHDGTPFTSADVVFTTKVFLVELDPRARNILVRCEEITAPDDKTVVFKLKEPFSPFLKAFDPATIPIYPRHIYEGTDFRKNPANIAPIGTGPFKFKEWKRGSQIELVRNENYWQKGKPYLDGIQFRILPDANARGVALETGQADIAAFSDIEPFDVPRLQKQANLELTTKGYEYFSYMTYLMFNLRSEPFNKKEFRQAINYAIDKEFISKKLFFGLGKAPTGPIPSNYPFYEKNVAKYPVDVKKAQQLLDSIGLKPDASGIRARVTIDVMPFGPAYVRMAEYTKQGLSKIGVDVKLRIEDTGTWSGRLANWDFEMSFLWLNMLGDEGLHLPRLFSSQNIRKIFSANSMGYVNPKVDELMSVGVLTTDQAKRREAYGEVQKVLVDELPVLSIMENQFPTLYSKKFHNLINSATGVRDNYADAYMDPS